MADTPAHFASLFGSFQDNIATIIFGIVLTFSWSYLWPRWIRDEEGQRLPPSSLARATFSLSIILVYLALVGAAFLLPSLFANLSSPTADAVIRFLGLESFQKHVPFGVLLLMGILYSIPQIKELFERWAYFLHASQYRRTDEALLRRHLESCRFNISAQEADLNRSFVQQFDVYVTDNNSVVIRDETVDLWRKVGSLLRLLQKDFDGDNGTLSERDKVEVQKLEEAHRRKTLLAMNIIRMLDQMEAGQAVDPKVARIAQKLSDASHRDREGVRQAEEAVGEIADVEIVTGSMGEIQQPVRLSSKQFAQYLSQISGYFLKEYQMILHDASRLAAKAIIRAGDDAPERLEAMKAAGFAGLGRIERHNFDGVLSTLLATWITVVASFLITSFAIAQRNPNAGNIDGSLIFAVALVVAIATTIGSIWGSRRALIERRTIPWSSYLTAGFIAMLCYFFVHAVRFEWNREQAIKWLVKYRPDATSYSVLEYLGQTWPFSISLLFLVTGIGVLARRDGWPWAKASAFRERATDGVLIGLTYAAGAVFGYVLHGLIGTTFGDILRTRLAEGDYTFLIYLMSNVVIGFVIGFMVLREVRRIAHSHILATPKAGPAANGVSLKDADRWAEEERAALVR